MEKKTVTIEIPEGKRAEWVNGVLTLVDEQPVEFKFKVGDKVKIKHIDRVETITELVNFKGTPAYRTASSTLIEAQIEPYIEPKDITERIKTFADAYEWCEKNNKQDLAYQYESISETIEEDDYDVVPSDILAYLKLRIITCALNEGWKPTFEEGEKRYAPYIQCEETDDEDASHAIEVQGLYGDAAKSLDFKSRELAEYAAVQFKDIYMDFCYKGKE